MGLVTFLPLNLFLFWFFELLFQPLVAIFNCLVVAFVILNIPNFNSKLSSLQHIRFQFRFSTINISVSRRPSSLLHPCLVLFILFSIYIFFVVFLLFLYIYSSPQTLVFILFSLFLLFLTLFKIFVWLNCCFFCLVCLWQHSWYLSWCK